MKPTRSLALLLASASCAGPRALEPAAPAAPAAVAAPAAPAAPAHPSGRPEIRYYEIAEA